MVFAALWGFPFLVAGEGLAPTTAGTLLMVLIVAGMVLGPALGAVVARHPFQRSWLVLGTVGVTAAAWAVVLAWPGQAPLPVLVVLMLALAANGPASAIGFDYARTFNPARRLGSATGIVNVGGFLASLVTLALVGLVLDVLTPGGGAPGRDAFRVAFAVQYPIWTLGVLAVLRARRQTRRRHGLSPDHPLPARLTTG